jgi:hypothetical protein
MPAGRSRVPAAPGCAAAAGGYPVAYGCLRLFFPVHNRDVLSGKIFDATDILRVPASGQYALFPNGKCDHRNRVFGEKPGNLR